MLEFLNSTKHQSKNLKDVLIQHPFYLYPKERAGVGHMHVLFFESQFNPKTYFLAFNQYEEFSNLGTILFYFGSFKNQDIQILVINPQIRVFNVTAF